MTAIPTPRTRGLHSLTFTQPPLDGAHSLPTLFEWQLRHSPSHPLFVFQDVSGSLRTIRWSEASQAMQRATRLIREAVGSCSKYHDKNPPVVSVLASSDTITFATFIVGALRSGCTLFPLAPRCTPESLATLLKESGTLHLFISSDKAMQELARTAMKYIESAQPIQVYHFPTFDDLYPVQGIDSEFDSQPSSGVDMDSTALRLHSSGTTAFPKQILITHRSLVQSATLACFGETDLAGSVVGCHSLPMFHGMGMVTVILMVSTGITIAAFKPQFPPRAPNPANTFQESLTCRCDYIYVAPAIIDEWSRDRSTVEALVRIKGVIYGTAPLQKAAGDALAAKGVNIFTVYATTQTYVINDFLQKPAGMDWEYFRMSPAREVHFIEHGKNEFEVVLLTTNWYRPSVINTRINGRLAYATSDLVSPHPTKSGYWKIVGRADDQITHSTGQKTNPGPLESALMQDQLVSGAIVFGRGRNQCGVILEPRGPYAFDPTDNERLATFRTLIWPTIEAINDLAPRHSRIFKEAILVASPDKPFSYTAKGTLRRQAIISAYAPEIDAMYSALDEGYQDEIPPPSDWNHSQATRFIRRVVQSALKKADCTFGNDADLFEMGIDSVQAIWIRNTILRVLHDSHPSAVHCLTPTLVFDYPSITRLVNYVSACINDTPLEYARNTMSASVELGSLLKTYAEDFPIFEPKHNSSTRTGRVVLLTGGTGTLGSNILAKLLEDSTVTGIYAMFRPPSTRFSAKEKHKQAFLSEGLCIDILDHEKLHFINGDGGKDGFGVDQVLFKELQTSVTHIVLNGWRVNFNNTLTSFVPNIHSVRNFVNFSLGSTLSDPPRILFISSISVLKNHSIGGLAPEEHVIQPDLAIGSGYAESKWVSEQILRRASEHSRLSTTIIRCGQLTGGPSGAWNSRDWFPIMIRSSITIGKLPDSDWTVSWIGADDAAGAITEMLDVDDDVVHVTNPKPISWSWMIAEFSKKLGLTVVPYTEWFHSLESICSASQLCSSELKNAENAFHDNPAEMLLEFFRANPNQGKGPYSEPLREDDANTACYLKFCAIRIAQ